MHAARQSTHEDSISESCSSQATMMRWLALRVTTQVQAATLREGEEANADPRATPGSWEAGPCESATTAEPMAFRSRSRQTAL